MKKQEDGRDVVNDCRQRLLIGVHFVNPLDDFQVHCKIGNSFLVNTFQCLKSFLAKDKAVTVK